MVTGSHDVLDTIPRQERRQPYVPHTNRREAMRRYSLYRECRLAARRCLEPSRCGRGSEMLTGMSDTLSFGYDGDRGLGDRLLAAVLAGEKTATSSLAVEYLSGEPLPQVGQRLALVDHAGQGHGMVETTKVTIIPLNLVGDDVAKDEGEGFADASAWLHAHVAFWAEVADLVRTEIGDPNWTLREAEPVVVHWFHLLEATAPTAVPTS